MLNQTLYPVCGPASRRACACKIFAPARRNAMAVLISPTCQRPGASAHMCPKRNLPPWSCLEKYACTFAKRSLHQHKQMHARARISRICPHIMRQAKRYTHIRILCMCPTSRKHLCTSTRLSEHRHKHAKQPHVHSCARCTCAHAQRHTFHVLHDGAIARA